MPLVSFERACLKLLVNQSDTARTVAKDEAPAPCSTARDVERLQRRIGQLGPATAYAIYEQLLVEKLEASKLLHGSKVAPSADRVVVAEGRS